MNDLSPAEIEALSKAMGSHQPYGADSGAVTPSFNPKATPQKPLGIEASRGGISRLQYTQLREEKSDKKEPLPEQQNQALQEVKLNLEVVLGRTKVALGDLLKLQIGNVVPLNSLAGEPVDVLINGLVVAKGEVVVIEDEHFGIRFLEFTKEE